MNPGSSNNNYPEKNEVDHLSAKLTGILQIKNKSLSEKFGNYMVSFEPSLFPMNIHKLYPGYATYILELGSGWGEFALEYAKQNPDSMYIALDKKKYRIKKSVKEQFQKKISNIRWMICNLEWIFHNVFEKKSFDKIIINFPDPWPKTRHQKHRFVGPKMIEELLLILKPGGIVEFATDNWPYMEEGLAHFESSGKWENIHGKGIILSQIPDRPESFFENLKKSEKENIYIIQLKKLY